MRDVDRLRQCHRPKNRFSKNKTRKPTVERLRSPHRLKLENDVCWDGQQKLANSKGDLNNSRFVVYAPFQVPEKTPLVAEVEAYGCRNFTRKCSTAAVTMATSNHRSLEEMSQRSGGSSCISCLPSFEASSLPKGVGPTTLTSSSILQWTSPHWYTINKANFKNYLGSLIAKKAWAARLKTFIIMMNSNMKDAVQSEFDLEASPNDWSGQVTYHGSTWNSLKKEVFTVQNHPVWWFFCQFLHSNLHRFTASGGKKPPMSTSGGSFLFLEKNLPSEEGGVSIIWREYHM